MTRSRQVAKHPPTAEADERVANIVIRRPLLDRALGVVLACVEPHRVLVFGSQQRGDANAHSDLDLLVIADAGPRQHFLARELREALGMLALPVDVVLHSPAEVAAAKPTSFLAIIAATGKVIYAPKGESAAGLTGNAHS